MPRESAIDLIARPEDAFMNVEDAQSDDIIILIMGQTGAGKSTVGGFSKPKTAHTDNSIKFVNNVFNGATVAETSNQFESCTKQLAHYIMPIPTHWATRYHLGANRRLVLVDSPGFDDTNVSDSEILRRIAVWLSKSYGTKTKVSGIVYIHPIYPNRMTRNDCSNVKVFRKICGDAGLSKVILATTRWDVCPEHTGNKREEDLAENFWTNLLRNPQAARKRATMMRLLNTTQQIERLKIPMGARIKMMLGLN
ncbi:hypothetical protein MD484_g6180, partial [Candolleomyces efflorescens]